MDYMRTIAKFADANNNPTTLEYWPSNSVELFGPDEYRIVKWIYGVEHIIIRTNDVVEATTIFGIYENSYAEVKAVEPDWDSQEEYQNAFDEWCEQNYCHPFESRMFGDYNDLYGE